MSPVLAPSTVTTTLNYFGNPDGQRIFWESPNYGTKASNIIDEPHETVITDINSLPAHQQEEFKLDICGFQYFKQPSAEKAFIDGQLAAYEKECEEFIKKVTGASLVHVSTTTVRRNKVRPDFNSAPAPRVHSDQSPLGGTPFVKKFLGEKAEKMFSGRLEIINLWRPITGPVKDTPLAVVDTRNVDRSKELVSSTVYYPDYIGEAFCVKYSPQHKWYYKSDMTTDECLLIKIWESEVVEGRPCQTPHTAFFHPDAPEDWPQRQSLEVRAWVFHEK